MTVVELEGPVRDLAEALGLLKDGRLQSDFLSDPGATLKGMLVDAERREKLLAVVQALLAQADLGVGPARTVDARDWLPVIGTDIGVNATNQVDVSIVLDHSDAAHTLIGIGVRYTHDATGGPRLALEAILPLVVVPTLGDAALAPGTAQGDIRIDVLLEPRSTGGELDLESLGALLDVPTDGVRAPRVVVTAHGLRLGDDDPTDLVLDTSDPLVDQALHIAANVLRGLAEAADPRLAALLQLLGLGGDPAIPALPLEGLLAHGRAAFWQWLASLAAPATTRAWMDVLADLISVDAVVDGDGSVDHPARLRLPVGAGTFEVALLTYTEADGTPVLVPRISVDVETAAGGGVPRLLARAEIDVVELRLAAVPNATAIPGLRLMGRAGPDAPRGAAAPLVEQPVPRVVVGSFAAGLALDADRRTVPLLAAYEVEVGAGDHQVNRSRVDLTDAGAIADLGADALDALVDQALAALGVGDEVHAALALLGLRDPHGVGGVGQPAWTHRVELGALLADPLHAIAAYLADVVQDGGTPTLLGELALLLPSGGGAPAVGGSGTESDPWTLPLDHDPAADVVLTAVRSPDGVEPLWLRLGVRVGATPLQLGDLGGLAFALDAELVRLTLPQTTAASASLVGELSAGARLVGPLRLGSADVVVSATALDAGLRWSPLAGLRVTGAVEGLELSVDGEAVPFALPRVDPGTGRLEPPDPLPWEALEALAGYALRQAEAPWVHTAPDVFGWGRHSAGPGSGGHLALSDLVVDPVRALLDFLRATLIGGGAREALEPLMSWLAGLVGDLAADADAADAALRGTGTPSDPWALRLRAGHAAPAVAGGAGRSGELLLWCEPDGPALPFQSSLTALALPSWLVLGSDPDAEPPEAADLAAALADAATLLPEIADVMAGRTDLGTSLAALRDRLAGGDGLLPPSTGPTPPGWTATALAGVAHADLQAAWTDEALDPATTIFVSGPLGDPARWPLYDASKLIDLTAPGLPPEAFDLSAPASGPGPWFVALPTRAAARVDPAASGDGLDELAARLARAVSAAQTHVGGPVTVVAHSTAGMPARLLAATAAGAIGRLVTLGTPLDSAQVSFLDVRPAADAVLTLRALWTTAGLDAATILAGAAPFDPVGDTIVDELVPAAALLAALDGLYAFDPFPAADLTAPAAWPAEAAAVTRESVTGALDTVDVQRALALAVRGALHASLARLGTLPPVAPPAAGDPADGAVPTRRPAQAIAAGVRQDLAEPADARGIVVTTRVAITGPRLGADPGDDAAPAPPSAATDTTAAAQGAAPLPALRAPAAEIRLILRRDNGWLVGGPRPEGVPAPATRGPRVRWAEVIIGAELRGGGSASAAIVLHEAAALGVERIAWTLRLDEGATLPAEARVLLFRLASALGTTDDAGALPATGTGRALVDLLAALGLATVDTQGQVGLVSEAIERLLVAPATALREAGARGPAARRELTRALRVLVGAALPGDEPGSAAPATPAPARVDVAVDGVRLVLDLEPMTAGGAPTVTVDAGLALAGVLGLAGAVTIGLIAGPPQVSGSLQLGLDLDPADSGPTGLPTLALDLPAGGAPALELRLDLPGGIGATWLPRRVALYPVTDPAQLEPLLRLALAHAPAELARMVAERARTALAGTPQAPLLEGLLDALGLLASGPTSRPVRVPMALVLDPGGWLRHALGLDHPAGAGGHALVALVDALRGLLGLGDATTPSGRLPLPYGLQLAVSGDPSAGGLAVALATTAPVAAAGAAVSVEVSLRLRIDPVAGVRAQPRLVASLGLQPPGAAAALAAVQVTAEDSVALALVLPGTPERTLQLVPAGPGLGDLLGAAAVRLLPTVLDAVVAHAGAIGAVAADLGDALGVRSPAGAGGSFQASALATLAEDPAAALLARLEHAAGDLATALGDLAEHVLGGHPPGFLAVTATGDHVEILIAGHVTLALHATGTGLRLDVGGTIGVRVDGTELGTVEAAVGIDEHGLAGASAGISVDGDLLVVLGVPLRPWVRAHVSPADRSPSGAETPTSRPTLQAGLEVPAAAGAAPRIVSVTVAVGQPVTFAVVDSDGVPTTDDAALAVVRVLVPLLVAIATESLQDALASPAGAGGDTVGNLFDGVLLQQVGTAGHERWAPVPDLLDPAALLGRIVALAHNFVEAYAPALDLGPATLRADASLAGTAVTVSLQLSIAGGNTWWIVGSGDLRIGVEVATDWLALPASAGGALFALTIDPAAADPLRNVTVAIRGLTLRVAGSEGGDLIDLGVRIRSIALSAAFDPEPPTLYGGRLQFDRLAIPIGAGGGGNAVASKMLDSDSTGGGTGDTQPPAPAVSPELSLVSRDGGPIEVDLRAGEGDGPWWLALQAQLGPVYVEQVGFGVLRSGGTIVRLRLLVDGGVSLAGLTVQVDDLELRLPWPEPWDVSHWELDLAGLAVGYESSSVSLAGALIRNPPERVGDPPSYLGMVTIEAAGFGINAFGGFGVFPVPDSPTETYVSFFVIAAVHAPLGGVPAFFVTGVGGGIGINRLLILPTDITALPTFPLVQALDPESDLASDPMGALQRMGQSFPPQRGAIWFAAGISFTSFSLVEGVVLLSVSVGGSDFEIALFGLARLGLPNPDLPLAEIELALLARFSTRDMVLWIQAQLTDNSWVISRDARLTGGFAFVSWFRTGDFVLTLGGYHPDFHSSTYPQVPRLGLSWTLGDYLSIRGEAYFALCSSAVMAGSRLDASLQLGPGYARVVAGFDALIKFDPFWFEVDVYASVTGGIRIHIDLGWFGSITIDLVISIGARLHIEGPEVRGLAVLELGPIEVPFRFGPDGVLDQSPLSWTAFRDKYLLSGGGQILSISVGAGRVTAPGSPDESHNDGSDPSKPWQVLPEFDLGAATTMAAAHYAGAPVAGVGGLSVGPMQLAVLSSDWRVTVRAAGVTGAAGDHTARFASAPNTAGLPVSIWRALPAGATPAVPSGTDLVTACTGVLLRGAAQLPVTDEPAQFDPYQVEQDRARRKPLPFPTERAARPDVRPASLDAVRLDVAATPQSEVMATVLSWLAANRLETPMPVLVAHGLDAEAAGDPERVRLLRRRARGWQAVPRPVRITEGLAPPAERPVPVVDGPAPPEPPQTDRAAGAPRLVALLADVRAVTRATQRTTVTKLRGGGQAAAIAMPRRAPPSIDLTRAIPDRAVPARLVLAHTALVGARRTVVPTDGGVRTAQAGALVELRRGPAGSAAGADALAATEARMRKGGTSLVPGQVLVLAMPNPHDDADPHRPGIAISGTASVRVVALDAAGGSLCDSTVRTGRVDVPARTARVALVGVGAPAAAGFPGWYAGMRVAEVSPGTAVIPGGIVRGPASSRRGGAVVAATLPTAGEVVRGIGLVETTLPDGMRTLVVALDRGTGSDTDLNGLVIGLAGLRRRTGPDGELRPRAVTVGTRTILLYAVEDDPSTAAGLSGTGTVSVASDERWELAGIVGATLPVDRLAEEVAATSLEALVAPLVPSPVGTATVAWISGGKG